MSGRTIRLVALALAIVLFFADQLSKFWVQENIPSISYSDFLYPYGGIPVFHNFFGIEFSIVHATNLGAAWGILASYSNYLLYFRIILIVGAIIYLIGFNKNRAYEAPFMLIIAGASANVLDFFIYGHVIDMLHFVLWGYNYPIFNVADTTIFIGIAWTFLVSWLTKEEKIQHTA